MNKTRGGKSYEIGPLMLSVLFLMQHFLSIVSEQTKNVEMFRHQMPPFPIIPH